MNSVGAWAVENVIVGPNPVYVEKIQMIYRIMYGFYLCDCTLFWFTNAQES